MQESNLTINFEPVSVDIMLNALYDVVTGIFVFDPNDFSSTDFETT
jgi:hypothetical protein